MTIAGYIPYFTIYSNAGTISLASDGIIVIPAPVVVPPIEPVVPPSASGGGYAGGGGASRGRMIRKFRKREDEDLAPPPLAPSPPDLKPPLLSPAPLDLKPPLPGLMAGMSITQARLPPTIPLDEDEEEIALLLELIS